MTDTYVEAAVSAALRNAVEECRKHAATQIDNGAFMDCIEGILALPHDDSALRAVCMRVAREVCFAESGCLVNEGGDVAYLQDIVDRALNGVTQKGMG